MIVKEHIHENKLVLACCDESIKGKKFENKNIVLDLSSHFYQGRKVSNEEFLDLVKKSYIVNAVGKDIIKLLIKNKIISMEEVKLVKGVPYIQLIFEDNI